MQHRYPIYIISKGRWDTNLTHRCLASQNIPHHVVIEPVEYEKYAAKIDPSFLLMLPFSDLGQGSIPARNWVWEHSISAGYERHWILDDNIETFYQRVEGRRIRIKGGGQFRIIEDFVLRYENIAMAGMHYRGFITELIEYPPIFFNTRIFSCILILNSLPHRWRGRYNEDTDLSLRVLKDGWCTALFNAFLCAKQATMTMKGGNTELLYKLDNADGRLLMAQSLQRQHPDVVKITRRWGRWQHSVNYKPFRMNKLIPKPGIVIPDGPDNYGLVLTRNGIPVTEQ